MIRAALAASLALSPALVSAQGTPRPAALDVEAGLAVTGRHLSYNDDLFGRTSAYDLTAAPGLYGRVVFHPGALTENDIASMFGLTLGGDWLAARDSVDARGNNYAVRAWGFSAGLRVRIPIPTPDVGVEVAYVRQRFTLGEEAPGLDGAVPGVDAESLRVGASGRFELSRRLALSARAAWLTVLSTGDAAARYFPRHSTAAVEASLGASVGLTRGLELRVGVDYRRYFSSMNPEPGDPYIVGGSVDQYVTATLGAAWRR